MFTEGALLLERVARRLDPADDPRGPAARRGAALGRRDDDRAGRRGSPGGAPGPRRSRPCSRPHPLRELVTVEGPYPSYADRARALFGSWYEFFPRSEGAPPRRRDRQGHQRHVPHRRRAARRGGRDGLRRDLPAADPPDRRGQPQGPEQHPRPRAPTTPARPGRSAARTAATTRSTPTSARSSDFDAFVAQRRRARARGGARPGAAGGARPPVGRPGTPSGSPPAPTAPSPTPRTRRRSTRTSTRSTSTTTRTASAAEVLRVVRHWMAHGVRIFRVDNPHTKPVAFWEWLLARGPRAPTPTCSSSSEAFTRPAMMHGARRGRLPPELHLLHLAHRQVGDRGLPPRALAARPTT